MSGMVLGWVQVGFTSDMGFTSGIVLAWFQIGFSSGWFSAGFQLVLRRGCFNT